MLPRSRRVNRSGENLPQPDPNQLVPETEALSPASEAWFVRRLAVELAGRLDARTAEALIERARHMAADKRRHERVQLNTSIDGMQRFDVIALETALVRLGSIDAQLSEIVELRYFAGMTLPEVAEILEVSESTALRRWQAARAWLGDALSNPVVP